MNIARVFPTKTSMTPTDPLAFFGPPTLDAIAAEPDEVHISVTFCVFRRAGTRANDPVESGAAYVCETANDVYCLRHHGRL